MNKGEFEIETGEAYYRAKAGVKAVKKIAEDAVEELGNQMEKVSDYLEAEYRRQRGRTS